jgi:endonuclease
MYGPWQSGSGAAQEANRKQSPISANARIPTIRMSRRCPLFKDSGGAIFLFGSGFAAPLDRDDFIELFEKAKGARETLVFFCDCEITYSGRAEAFLPLGGRVIVIKQDGVLLVHQPEGGNPINYLKAGGELMLEKYEGHLLLHGKYVPNKEFIDIELFRIQEAIRRKLEDGQRQVLTGNEADMSDMIREHPALISKEFRPVSREEHTAVGFVDVFGHDGEGNLVVIECKRYTAGLSAVSQLHRYVEKIKQLRGTPNVTGIMASPKISPNALEMLQGYGYAWRHVHPPNRHERHERQQRGLGDFASIGDDR